MESIGGEIDTPAIVEQAIRQVKEDSRLSTRQIAVSI